MKNIFIIPASSPPVRRPLRQFIPILRDSVQLQNSYEAIKDLIKYSSPFRGWGQIGLA